jgi:hypothetical protein
VGRRCVSDEHQALGIASYKCCRHHRVALKSRPYPMMDWSKHPAGVVQHSVNVPGVNASHDVSQSNFNKYMRMLYVTPAE